MRILNEYAFFGMAGAERFELSTRGFGVDVDITTSAVICAFAKRPAVV